MIGMVATSNDMKVIEIRSDAEFNAALTHTGLVVVDFFADWCGPCRAIAPKLQELAKKHPAIHFHKVDVDTAAGIANRMNVSAMPTVVFFKCGREVDRVVGANLVRIQEAIGKHM